MSESDWSSVRPEHSPLQAWQEPELPAPADLVVPAMDARYLLENMTDGQILLACSRSFASWAWQREAVAHAGIRCMRVVERKDVPGPDRITRWPAAVVELVRTPWKYGQTHRTCRLLFSFDEHNAPVVREL